MIRKGIPGISKIRREDVVGWHVFLIDQGISDADSYRGYFRESFSDIVARYDSMGADLVTATGNGLTFTTYFA